MILRCSFPFLTQCLTLTPFGQESDEEVFAGDMVVRGDLHVYDVRIYIYIHTQIDIDIDIDMVTNNMRNTCV